MNSQYNNIKCRIKVIEQVLDQESSEIYERITEAPIFTGQDGPHIWHWQDGNMACDCSRGSICNMDIKCNPGKNRFLLNLLNANDRSVLYQEFDSTRHAVSHDERTRNAESVVDQMLSRY
jgi:hypothetical protein